MRFSKAVWEGRPAKQLVYADITAQKQLAENHEREQERLEARIRARTEALEHSQQQLREQERLAALGTLAAGIAHQINNPVGAILTSADFALLVEGETGADQIRKDALLDIRNQAIRCGKIVRGVLQFSRAESTEKWQSDLPTVHRTAIEVTNRSARERDDRVEFDVSPRPFEGCVRMNPIEIEKVFVNLIQNALEAQPNGARVQISTRLIGDSVEICVADDGPGLDVASRRHFFEPFFTTRLREGGTGLGLSVAHGIIEEHGGNRRLDPASGGLDSQTRFLVHLPIEKPEALVRD